MEYTIKQIAKKLDISEQAIYKRIKNYNEDYMQRGFLVVKLVEQPNGTTKNQTFITDSGLEFLLEAQRLRNNDFKLDTTEVEQPLNQGLNNHSTKVEQPQPQQEIPNDTQSLAFEQIKQVLNQQIEDLKADNKRLIEKIETQEQKFDAKYEQQKLDFKEQFDNQQRAYQLTLDKILGQYNTILQRLPEPQEDIVQPTEITAEQPQEHRGFFSRLFGHK